MERRKTEIIIQTRERIFVRGDCLSNDLQTACAGCQIETMFITPERAVEETGVSVREIFRAVENGAIHFVETSDGLTLVCRQSLVKAAADENF